jgi:trans-aconitate methyltransferase
VERPSWAPRDIDIERPSPARIYDYHLGGAHNFAVDRQVAAQLAEIMPELPLIMRANRAFLRRAVGHLLDAGIRQFLDLGSGIPTVGNVHEIVTATAPGSRVVYVDCDPVAVAHSRALLTGDEHAAAVQADLRDVSGVLDRPEVRQLIDRSRPVGLLLVAVLHFVPDADDPAGIVARYRAVLAPGSYVVISHAAACEDQAAPVGADAATAAYSRSVTETTLRTRSQVTAMFAGLDLVDPGVGYVDEWRPDPGTTPDGAARRLAQFVGVGMVPPPEH